VCRRISRSPVLQGFLAFVAAINGLTSTGARVGYRSESTFEGVLLEIQTLLGSAKGWQAALDLRCEWMTTVQELQQGQEAVPEPAASCQNADRPHQEEEEEEKEEEEEEEEEAAAAEGEAAGRATSSSSSSLTKDELKALQSDDSDAESDAHQPEKTVVEQAQQSSTPKFRASCVRGGSKHSGFRSNDVMACMGAGVRQVFPEWDISIHDYDIEVQGFFCEDSFAAAIWLGHEWRVNSRGKVRKGQDRNYNVVPLGDRRPYLAHSVPHLPRLRPSTAHLLLQLSNPKFGETLLDPFGGVGTVAVEAACSFPSLTCISSDKDVSAYHVACNHCGVARKGGWLKPGSIVKSRRWDARKLKLEDDSVDVIVSDLPFLNKCTFRDGSAKEGTSARGGLAASLSEMARVLCLQRRGLGGAGRATLLLQSRKLLLDALAMQTKTAKNMVLKEALRPVVIGGFPCVVATLDVQPPSGEARVE